jgi:hypothetical protein
MTSIGDGTFKPFLCKALLLEMWLETLQFKGHDRERHMLIYRSHFI